MININYLKIPLYKLHYIDDVRDFTGFTEKEIRDLRNVYNEQDLKKIVEAVSWATQNPDYNFSSLLSDLHHSNTDIYRYLCTIRNSLHQLNL